MKVIVDGQLINYQLTGNGKLILLLHGWGDNSSGLRNLQQALSASYQVLALDLPGFGESDPPKTAWGLEDYAKIIAGCLNKLNLNSVYAAIGHSNGGAILIKACASGLIRPQKLVLVAASGVRSGMTLRRVILNVLAKVGNIATIWLPTRYRDNLRRSLYASAGSDMLVVPELRETFVRIVKEDVQSQAATITTPTLLIYALNDQATPPSMGRQYNQLIKGSKLEVIENSGHFIHLDQPDKTIGLIEDFLNV